jgi:hypothetical protein
MNGLTAALRSAWPASFRRARRTAGGRPRQRAAGDARHAADDREETGAGACSALAGNAAGPFVTGAAETFVRRPATVPLPRFSPSGPA